MTAIILGLRFSIMVLAMMILLRVAFDWEPPVRQRLANTGPWWRAAWFLLAMGAVVANAGFLVNLNTPPPLSAGTATAFNMAGLALFALGLAFTQAGWSINRGSSYHIIWFKLAIPVGFVLTSIGIYA